MDGVAEIGPIISEAEASKFPERRYNRAEVLLAFNSTLDLLNAIPEEQLTPKERADRDLVNEIKGKTIDKGKASFVNRFKDEKGNEYSQREYIPVESLINFLNVNIESGKLSEDEKKDYEERRRIIARHSKHFYDLPHRLEASRLNARVHQEFERVQKDPRLDIGNWATSDLITDRRELILPKETKVKDHEKDSKEEKEENRKEEKDDEKEEERKEEEEKTTVEKIRVDIAITNQTTDPRKRAAELAEEFLHSEMLRGNILNPLNWGRKVGLRIMEEYWRQRLIQQIEASMQENNNSLLTLDMVKSSINLRDIFRSNIQNVNLDTNANRTRAEAERQDTNKQLRLSAQEGTLISGQRVEVAQGALRDMMVSEIIRPLVEGSITEDQIQDRLREFVRTHQSDPQVLAIFGPDANQYNRIANYFATDLKEATEVIRKDIAAHKYAIGQLNEVVRIQLANTDWAAETEAKFTRADRAVAWAERHRLSGLLANPAVIGAAFSLGTFATLRAIGMTAKVSQFIVPGAGLLPAALFAGFRRNYDLKVDRASHQVERAYNRQIPPDAPRREALERYAYNTASVTELLNGGGQELVGGGTRLSLENLLATDLTITANQEALVRRITEMKSRLDFSAEHSIDLVTFESRGQVSQGRLQLIEAMARAHIALRNAGVAEDVVNREERRLTGEWRTRLVANREQQDRSFAHYRLRQSLMAGAFGGAVGLTGSFVTQEAWAAIGRGVFHQQIGNTALENAFSGKPINEWFGPSRAPGFAIDQAKELYQHPGNLKISDNITLAIDTNHSGSLLDAAGNKIPTPPLNLTEDGRLVFSGKIDNLPEQVRNLVGAWENRANTNPAFNLQEHLKAASLAPEGAGHETFQHGDWVIDVNSGSNHQMSMTHWPTGTQIHGFIQPGGILDIDSTFGGNDQLSATEWQEMQNFLRANGWATSKEIIPGTGNALDTLLNQPPDTLKAQGILETDQFKKTWHFHVLRPDIVDATGNHTHNELTLHLGGEYQVATKSGDQIIPGKFRHGIGNPGELNTGSELHGGAIQSHLTGVPPQEDPVLNELIRKAGGLKMSDTVFVVDLTNGKQIMLPTDLLGNGKLPDGLYDPNTGSVRGIETIATAVLQKPDGSIINPTELFQTGKIPEGSIVHSLASERFLPGELPPTPPKEIFTFGPPIATEFDPPPPTELDQPPLIPIPFAPRFPLEPLDREKMIYPYLYLGEASEEQIKEYTARRSPRLNENPRAKLDAHREAEWYFSQQDPEYLAELEQLEGQIGEEMTNACRLCITMPVAAHQEEANIYNALQNYATQKDRADNHALDANKFEILIFLNRPENQVPDGTEREIERFKNDHPEVKVRVVRKIFKPEDVRYGRIVKYLNDIALLRSYNRSDPSNPDLIMVTNDADSTAMSKFYVNDLIEDFDKQENQNTDGILGKLDWSQEAYDKYPGFHAINRFWQYLDATYRHGYLPSLGSSGGNFALKASIYAGIGGYIPERGAGADQDLARMIKYARFGKIREIPARDYPIKYSNRAWLESNPRRGLDYYKQGIPIIYQWGDFDERMLGTDTARVKRWEGITTDEESLDDFSLERLEGEINEIIDVYEIKPDNPSLKRALDWLGVKVEFTEKEITTKSGVKRIPVIKITDASRLLQGLKRYKDQNLSQLKKREKTPTPQTTPGHRQPQRQTSQQPTPEQTRTTPGSISELANRAITQATGNQASVETTPQALSATLSSFDIPLGGRIEAQTGISGNQLNMTGAIGTTLGTARFTATLTTDQNGQLQLVSHELTSVPIGLRGQREMLERQVSELNLSIANQIKNQVNPAWEVAGFHITEGKLVLDFKKKATPTQAATPEQPSAEAATPTAPNADQVLEQVRQEGEQAVQQARERAQQIGQQAREQLRQDHENRMRRITEEYARANNISFEESSRRLEQQHPTQTIEPEMAPAQPADLLSQVNRQLAESTSTQTSFEAPPQAIINYLKTVKLPMGAQIKEVRTQTTGNQISMNGNITAKIGFIPLNIPFSAQLENDPVLGIRVTDHKINLPGPAEALRGRIEQNITNLNQLLLNQVNHQIIPSWEATGMKITDGKLALNFRKNETATSQMTSPTSEEATQNAAEYRQMVKDFATREGISEEEAWKILNSQ